MGTVENWGCAAGIVSRKTADHTDFNAAGGEDDNPCGETPRHKPRTGPQAVQKKEVTMS